MPRSSPKKRNTSPAALAETVDGLLSFAALMMGSGNSASRTHRWTELMGRKMGLDAITLSLTFDSVAMTGHAAGEQATAIREIAPRGIDARRISELEQLESTVGVTLTAGELRRKLDEIETLPPLYSCGQIAPAIGLASGGFAFLNGGGAPEIIAAAIAGGIGQWIRHWLSRNGLNQFAVAASGSYVVIAAALDHGGLAFTHYPAGFISSVLFLVPGFPLIAALFDLLQHRTVAAVSRFAYGVMLLLAITFGLSIVIEISNVDLSKPPPVELAYPLKLLLRGVASFVAGCAFAMLFNNSPRTVLMVGLLALGANELRLALNDMGMMLAPAAFFGALAIGITAVVAEQRFSMSSIGPVVPAIIIMVPGLYAYETIVLFNRGQVIEALQACAQCGFIIGALAMGLATARLFGPR